MRRTLKAGVWILTLACACGDVDRGDWRWLEPGQQGSGLTKGQPGAQNGDLDYCNDLANRCVLGEGDCDADSQCTSGTVCGYDNGPNFNMTSGWDVCVPPSCRNGVQDAGEAAPDCGGTSSCGACPTCTPTSNGTPTHCTMNCPCPAGHGDCDLDNECQAGLVCGRVLGEQFGMTSEFDVCVAPHCANGQIDAAQGETGLDCGGECGSCLGTPDPSPCTLSSTWETIADEWLVTDVVGGTDGRLYGVVQYFDGSGDRWRIARSGDRGLNWPYIDHWTGLGSHATAHDVAVDGVGNVYVQGEAYDGSQRFYVVRKLSGGAGWRVVDQHGGHAPSSQISGYAGGIAASTTTSGLVFAAVTTAGNSSWVVRRTTNGGTSWSTVDSIKLAEAHAVAIAANGAVYVAGSIAGQWALRRSTDSGATWATVDQSGFAPGTSEHGCAQGGFASAVGEDASGALYVAGSCYQGGPTLLPWTFWEVRRSPSGAAGSWLSVDSFVDTASGVSSASPMDLAVSGNSIHVIGSGANNQWLVRSSEDGTTWATTDEPGLSTPNAYADGVGLGGSSLYAAGSIGDVSVVRRRACE